MEKVQLVDAVNRLLINDEKASLARAAASAAAESASAAAESAAVSAAAESASAAAESAAVSAAAAESALIQRYHDLFGDKAADILKVRKPNKSNARKR
jgi:peptidoglycan hydrolase CwlO-like protein